MFSLVFKTGIPIPFRAARKDNKMKNVGSKIGLRPGSIKSRILLVAVAFFIVLNISNVFADAVLEKELVVNHGDDVYHYDIYMPDGVSGEVSLVLSLHGLQSSKEDMLDGEAPPKYEVPYEYKRGDGTKILADERARSKDKFIVAYINGWENWRGNPSFNGMDCCYPAHLRKVDTLGAIEDIIVAITDRFTYENRGSNGFYINPKKIFATGISNGGSMAHKLACYGSRYIAAIWTVSFPLSLKDEDQECTPDRSVPVIMWHNDGDAIIPYYSNAKYYSADEGFEAWRNINKCNGDLIEVEPGPGCRKGEACNPTSYKAYENCEGGTFVKLYTVKSVEGQQKNLHALYPYFQDIAEQSWNQLKDFTSPGTLPSVSE